MPKCKKCLNKIEKGKEIREGINTFCSKSHRQEYFREKIRKQRDKIVVKKAKVREKKQNSIPRLTKELDSIFSKYIRLRDAIKTTGTKTHLKCYTCDELVEVTKAQNMHFIQRGFKKYRFAEQNCRGGCMRCNVLMHGNYIEYFTRLEKEIGREEIDEMILRKNEITKIHSSELQMLINIYKQKLKELG